GDAAGAFIRGGGLGDVAAGHFRALVEHLEAAPGGAVGRHRVRRQPLAVHERVQVLAGVGRGVQVGQGEGGGGRQLGGGGGRGRDGVRVGGRRAVLLLAAGQRGGNGDGQQEGLRFAVHGWLHWAGFHRFRSE